jgi:hypothetical protein
MMWRPIRWWCVSSSSSYSSRSLSCGRLARSHAFAKFRPAANSPLVLARWTARYADAVRQRDCGLLACWCANCALRQIFACIHGASTDVTTPRGVLWSKNVDRAHSNPPAAKICGDWWRRPKSCSCNPRVNGNDAPEYIQDLTKFNHCLPDLTPSECRCGAIPPATRTKYEYRLCWSEPDGRAQHPQHE